MSFGIQNNITSNLPVAGTGTLAGTITVNLATEVSLYSLSGALRAALDAGYAGLGQARVPIGPSSAIWLMGSAAGLTLGHKSLAGIGTVPGFPIPHIPGGAGGHPEPLKIAFGDISKGLSNSELVVVNPTAGNIDLHIIVWGEV